MASRIARCLTMPCDGKIECDAYVVPEGGTAMVYITDPTNRRRLTPRLQEIFRGLEGIDRILEPGEYSSFGLPDPGQCEQMADLGLAARDGYGFPGAWEGREVTVRLEPEASVATLTGVAAVSPTSVLIRNRRPSAVTSYKRGNTGDGARMRVSKSARGAPASNVEPVLTVTATSFLSGAR